ncbi:hypothetical protein H7171_00455 [Candidatus Saccharibacteria bacterium]|nr:hypothetical protein [Candidatus Saccharibacteria bacterium]
MDYGSFLKSSVGNVSKISTTYAKQSKFVGSRRQIRGMIIKQLSIRPLSLSDLLNDINDERLHSVLAELIAEGLISQTGPIYSL